MSVHHMTLVSFRLFRKNLGNLREFLGKWSTVPTPRQKITRTPMLIHSFVCISIPVFTFKLRSLRKKIKQIQFRIYKRFQSKFSIISEGGWFRQPKYIYSTLKKTKNILRCIGPCFSTHCFVLFF